jgi:hypothetical protein
MPKLSSDLAVYNRRVVRKWRLAVVGFHGSLLGVKLALAVTSRDVKIVHISPRREFQTK